MSDIPTARNTTGNGRGYSWSEITNRLRAAMNEDVPAGSLDLALAHRALRLVDQAQRAGRSQVEALRRLMAG